MIKLTITEKGGEPRSLAFEKDEICIGRVQSNDVVLPKGNISKRHTRVQLREGSVMVTDLQSTNGTFVNNRKIAETTVLRPGDKIFVGDFLVLVDQKADDSGRRGPVVLPPPPPPPPPPPGRATIARPTLASQEAEEDEAPSAPGDELDDLLNMVPPPKSGLRNRPAAVVAPPPPPPPPKRGSVLDEDELGLGDAAAPQSMRSLEEESGSLFGGSRTDIVDEDAPLPPSSGPTREAVALAALDSEAAVARALSSTSVVLTSAPPSPTAPRHITGPQPVTTNVPASGPVAIGDSSFDALVTNPAVTAVFVSSQDVHVERDGRLQRVTLEVDANSLADAVWQLAMTAQVAPASDNPVVDVRWADGSQLRALFPPLVAAGVVATLRRAHLPAAALSDIAGHRDVASLLQAALEAHRNILVVGPHPAALLLMGALAQAIPPDRTVIGLGTGLEGRPGWIEVGTGADQATILRTAASVPADHVVMGEALSQNLTEAWLAAAKSPQGVIAFVSGRTLSEGLAKVETLAASRLGRLSSMLLAETVDFAVSVNSFGDDGAWVTGLGEPVVRDGRLAFTSCAQSDDVSAGPPRLTHVGVSSRFASVLRAAGATLEDALIRST